MTSFPFIPMQPVHYPAPFSDENHLFQIKWDGVRILADCQQLSLWNRHARSRTAIYPEINEALRPYQRNNCLFDGEMISFGMDGKPSFQAILKRDLAHVPKFNLPVCYVVFDCLRFGDKTLLHCPIEERQRMLVDVLDGCDGVIQICKNYADGIDLFSRMQALGMEGVVAKRKFMPYIPGGKSELWKKIKCYRQLQTEAIGIKWQDGSPASLLICEQNNDQKTVVGSVSSGLTQKNWRDIRAYDTKQWMPGVQGTTILAPGILVEVQFLEWTEEARVRHPKVLRISFT